jgi:hypothetical protein
VTGASCTRNYDFLTAQVDASLSYRVRLRPTADTPRGRRRELLGLFGDVTEAFAGIVNPKSVDVGVHDHAVTADGHSSDDENGGGHGGGGALPSTSPRTINVQPGDESTVTAVKRRVVDESEHMSVAVPVRFDVVAGPTRVFLNQGLTWIDRGNTAYRKRKHHTLLNESPSHPLASLHLVTRPNSRLSAPVERFYDDSHEECEHVYEVEFLTHSDIWFVDDTGDEWVDAIARINRARLNAAFEQLMRSHDAFETYCLPSGFPGVRKHIRAVLTYDGPDADDLLAQYRRQWVASKLNPRVSGRVADGDRTLDVGRVDERMRAAELRRRVEAFLQYEYISPIHRVRVEAADGRPLVGTLSDGSVEWGENNGSVDE